MGSRRSASGNPTWRKKRHSTADVQKAAVVRPFAFIPLRAGSVAIAFVVDLVGPSPVRRLAYQRFPASDVPRFIRKVRIQNVIDLYTWTTPNGRKVSIALEEL